MLRSISVLVLLCGVQARETFVLNGDPVTDATKWPWQGSLKTSTGQHICGCVLVHADWLLTAAHCVGSGTDYSMEFGTVMLGEGQTVSMDSVTIHPDFNEGPGAFPNDIALIRTLASLVVGPTVHPVLLSTGAEVTQSECWITGWGSVDFATDGGSFPDQLHEAHIPVIESSTCTEKWGENYYADTHICTWDEDQRVGACNADAGGPLVCYTDSTWRLEGLFSWGYAECDTAYPSVFVRLYSYLGWICEGSRGDVCQGTVA